MSRFYDPTLRGRHCPTCDRTVRGFRLARNQTIRWWCLDCKRWWSNEDPAFANYAMARQPKKVHT